MAETTTLKSRIKHAYKTEVEWSNSTVPLLEGEVAYSSDKGNMYKVGNGTSKWSELPYSIPTTKSDIGLGNVENKSSATIRSELTKTNVTTALGYTPPTTNTTYGVATSSTLGLVKSGTDITVDSSGNVSVNDDSHNHVISNVDGLQSALDGKAASSHTHNYASSSSAGGSATSAVKLDSSAGSATQPVYFKDGKPVVTTYTLGKSVPSNAVFTDTHYASGTIINNSATATSNTSSALTNGNVYLNHVENGAVKNSHKISGSGATTVTTDSSGNIIITSTDTDTKYTHPTTSGNKHIPSGGASGQILRWSADGTAAWGADNNTTYSAGTGLSLSGTTFNHKNSVTAGTAQGDANKTLTFGGTFTIPTVSYDAQGHVTGKGTTTMTMPANPNTWRGIQNNLTSDSTTDSLSAAQGKVLKGLVDGKATSSHTHFINDISKGNTLDKVGGVNPVNLGKFDVARACRTAFMPADAITVEYTQDSGTTWVDYGAGDSSKMGLFSMNRGWSPFLGKTGTPTVGYGLRVTVEPIDRYAQVDNFYCWFTTQGHTCNLKIERSTIGAKTTFSTVRENLSVGGWSGANDIMFNPGQFGGGSGQTNNYYAYRFTFMITAIGTSTYLPQVTDLRMYGDNVWSTANKMMSCDHLYGWDVDQNATFPAKVTATTFSGFLSGNASTASSAAKLTTARTINGTSFDGSANITTTNWGTARNVYIADSDTTNTGSAVSVNGSGDATLKLPATIKATLTGNASTATKLATARTIQTNLASDSTASFDGSANVTPGVKGVLPVANGGTGNSSVDTTPTDGSTKMVTSGGVYTALSKKQNTIPAWDDIGEGSIALNNISNRASGVFSIAEGDHTTAIGDNSHTSGKYTTALGENSYAGGYSTNEAEGKILDLSIDTLNDDIITAWNSNSFSLAKGSSSHVEGIDCLALGDYSHAEGYETVAYDTYSHAEGKRTTAWGYGSHAEGNSFNSVFSSFSLSNKTFTSETSVDDIISCHNSNYFSLAYGNYSHVEGQGCLSLGYASHAEGFETIADNSYQHVQGKFNIRDTENKYAHIVGNGGIDARSNAYTLDWDGNGWYAGGLTVNSDLSVNGSINSSIITGTYLAGNQGTAIINSTAGASNFVTLIRRKSTNGVFQLYGYNNTIGFTYTDDTTISAGKNGAKYYVHLLKEDGNSSFPGTVYSVLLNGTKNCPLIGTTATAANQVACINSYAKNISIGGKWGGSSFANRNLTVSSSDIRLKENINNTEITDALSVINKISMHSFDWKDTNAHQSIGFIADELEEIDPHLAIGGGYDDDGSMNVKSVDTFYLLGYLTKGIQELSKENNNLREEIQNLKSLMAS